MVERLLLRAGLEPSLPWRLQVQKKLFCNSETPPFRVVSQPKKWAVYLKIKPGDNNSCHYCTLIMPNGLQSADIYSELKRVENELDRNWKHTFHEKDTMISENGMAPTEAASEPVGAATDDAAAKSMLRGWTGDPEKIRLILLAIQEIGANEFVNHQEHFVQLLCAKLGWEGVSRYEVGGVFTSLVRKNLIMRVLRGCKPVGYALTDDGWVLIRDLCDPPPPPAQPVPAVATPTTSLADTLRSFGPLAQHFVTAHYRLEQIAAREAELTAELTILRTERDEICNRLANQEVHQLLARLLEIRPPQQVENSPTPTASSPPANCIGNH